MYIDTNSVVRYCFCGIAVYMYFENIVIIMKLCDMLYIYIYINIGFTIKYSYFLSVNVFSNRNRALIINFTGEFLVTHFVYLVH